MRPLFLIPLALVATFAFSACGNREHAILDQKKTWQKHTPYTGSDSQRRQDRMVPRQSRLRWMEEIEDFVDL